MIINANAIDGLKTIANAAVDTCVTSPPYYGLRDYGMEEQIGLEGTPAEYVNNLVSVFREVRQALKDDGTLWLNIGDSYASATSNNGGYSDKNTLTGFTSPKTKGRIANENSVRRKFNPGVKPKDLIGIPWLLAFALRNDGWYLRQDIIWHKPNPMPESVTDRCTKAHEYIFLFSKSAKYYFDNEAIKEPADPKYAARYDTPFYTGKKETSGGGRIGKQPNTAGMKQYTGTRNKRDVWTVTTKSYKGAHFAVFPPDLIEPCILAGSRPGGLVLDPFCGSGTTCITAYIAGRKFIGIDLNPDYCALAVNRIISYCFAGGGNSI